MLGSPIRKSTDLADICSSPWLIAACHVLRRLLMPRHSPCALFSLTSSARTSYPSLRPTGPKLAHSAAPPLPRRPASLGSARGFKGAVCAICCLLLWSTKKWFSRIMQASEFAANCFYPFVSTIALLCCLLFHSGIIFTLFSFQGARSNLF